MSNDLAMFNQAAQVPAYLAQTFAAQSNLDVASGPPSLSIRGKVFRIVKAGEEKAITRFDAEVGEEVPVTMLSVIVINQGPFGARVYYGEAYNPDNPSGPKCFSLDGKTPDAAAPEPQAPTCAQCPHAVKGSRVTDNGTVTTACQYQRRLAVVSADKPDMEPLLLRLSPTSAYDPDTKNSPSGWFGWKQYLDFLSVRGVRHTAMVVTKMRFDPEAEHPKLLFSPARYLTEQEAAIIGPRIESEEVKALLEPSKGKPAAPAAPAATAAIPAPKPEQKSTPPVEVADTEEKPARRTVAKNAAKTVEADGIDALLDDWDA